MVRLGGNATATTSPPRGARVLRACENVHVLLLDRTQQKVQKVVITARWRECELRRGRFTQPGRKPTGMIANIHPQRARGGPRER